LIEAITYRLEDHTTSDDSTRYRDEEEVNEWGDKDPIKRFKKWLQDNGKWDDSLESYEEEAKKQIKEAADKAMEIEDPGFEDMFDYVYKDMPDILKQEKDRLAEELGEEAKTSAEEAEDEEEDDGADSGEESEDSEEGGDE